MKPTHKLSRRSFVTQVGGAFVGGGAMAFVSGRAVAQTYTGVTDADNGNPHRDRPGYGTGVRNRYTDRDTGPGADPQFGGRGPGARPQGSPSGHGGYSEIPSGCSDPDRSPTADPGGRGRSCGGRTPDPRRTTPERSRHCSDSDRGNSADPIGQGRRC